MKKLITTVLLLCLVAVNINAEKQDSIPRKIIHVIGFDFKPAYTFPTKSFFRGDNMAQSPIRTNLSGQPFKV